jgi:transcriptional regulator with XRE-family HTH domain
MAGQAKGHGMKPASKFSGQRLIERRVAHGISGITLAKQLGILPTNYYKYERGVTEPSVGVVAQMAEVLRTSTDYLCQRTDDHRDYKHMIDSPYFRIIAMLRPLTNEQCARIENIIAEEIGKKGKL